MEYNIPPFFSLVPSIFCWYIPFQMVDASIAMLVLPECILLTLDVSAARCTPGGYAGWLGKGIQENWDETRFITWRTIPSQKTTTWRTHPSQKFQKQKHLMATVDFCQPSEVLRWQVICDVLSENSTSQEYGILPPRAAGFIIRWQLCFFNRQNTGPVAIIFHELYPPRFKTTFLYTNIL